MAAQAPAPVEPNPPQAPPGQPAPAEGSSLPWFKMAAAETVLVSIALAVCGDMPTLAAGLFAVSLWVLYWVAHNRLEDGARLLAAAAALGSVPVLALLAMGAYNEPLWGAHWRCGYGMIRFTVERMAFGSLMVLLISMLMTAMMAMLIERHLMRLWQLSRWLCALGMAGMAALGGWQLAIYLGDSIPRDKALVSAPAIASLEPTSASIRRSDTVATKLGEARLELHRSCAAEECFAFVRRVAPNKPTTAAPSLQAAAAHLSASPEVALNDGTDMHGRNEQAQPHAMLAESDGTESHHERPSDAVHGVPREHRSILSTPQTQRHSARLPITLRHHRRAGALVLQIGDYIKGLYSADDLSPIDLLGPDMLDKALAPPPHTLWAALIALLGGLALALRALPERRKLAALDQARQGWCNGDGWLHFDDSPPVRIPDSLHEGPVLLHEEQSALAYRGALSDGGRAVEGTRASWQKRLRRRIIRYYLEALAWSAVLMTPLMGLGLLSL